MSNLSNKELNYLKDYLSWELLLAKKCHEYSYQAQIQGFNNMFSQAAQLHQQNYENLLNYLEQKNQEVGY